YLRAHEQTLRVPGLVVVLQAGKPSVATLPVSKHAVELGRGTPHGLFADDEQVSRGHVRAGVSGNEWTFEDLGSRNGTFVDGVRLEGTRRHDAPALLRIGRSLLWAVEDVRPFVGQRSLSSAPPARAGSSSSSSAPSGPVLGGMSRRALGEIAIATKAGDTLSIVGESGAGKEFMARAFHEAHYGPGDRAPFVAVNCAAIPEGLAERLLFGAKRGAYSGAVDADGYIQDAHGGTLFLDEIAELDLQIQAKLLRVFETREVVSLGSTQPRKVQIRICTATHKDMRAEASAGRFRADLYYRIGRPEVRIPPLRERIDEIPWLLQRVLCAVDPQLSASVATVEHCALRHWPGNVRELLAEAKRAAHVALHEGESIVRPEHFAAEAGLPLEPSAGSSSHPVKSAPDDSAIEAALAAEGGNVTRAARALGMHRNQLRRWLAKRTGVPET
ncbi:MAG TPA: sigma 54-interacting transcriptional regulator, partial [Polyangiales bacterium]